MPCHVDNSASVDKSLIMKRKNITDAIVESLSLLAIVVGVLFIVRLHFCYLFESVATFSDNAKSLPLLILNAFRFDLQVATYFTLPAFMLFLLQVFINGDRYCAFRAKFNRIYTVFISVIIFIIGISDNQFYLNFKSHFNVVAFDFFDEEPAVLIKGIADEAPMLLLVLGIAILSFVSLWAQRRLARLSDKVTGKIGYIVLLVIFIILIPSGMRGSYGTFTLRYEDVYVSPSMQLNDCVPNALFMLRKAYSEKRKQFALDDESTIAKQYGFDSVSDIFSARKAEKGYLPTDSVPIEKLMFGTTGTAPMPNYNVVLIVTESWSNRLVEYDSIYGVDLLCGMRRHLSEDIVFRNFISAQNATIDAVETFTVNSMHEHLFTSKYRNIEYPCASARMFLQNGYETSFISGIEIAWRNLMEVLPHQGFQNVVGKFELLKERPNAECNKTWGVYDHEMLDYVFSKLTEKSDKPRFIMALTSTSHTPFEFPQDYPLPQIDFGRFPQGAFSVDEKIVGNYLKGFQYESQALGEFMSKIKNSDLAYNTVVMITGDHNIRLILPYDGIDEKWRYSVPLYVYIPQSDRQSVNIDTSRYGSHHDIMPTIANLTLSNAEYFDDGQNLFADSLPNGAYGINAKYEFISPDADSAFMRKRIDVQQSLKKIYFQRLFLNGSR